MSKANTIYVICGPTAVGKSAVAMQLAQKLGTAIVSADSRQCYKGMDIGTAKPILAEQAAIPHYFIDEFPVTQNITAADYENLTLGYLNGIFANRNTAVICGGTGLYIKALCEGLDPIPAIDIAIETYVNTKYKELGIAWLQGEIAEHDPLFHITGEVQNPMRMIRALVFKLSTGNSIVSYRTGIKKERPFNIVKVGIELPRQLLYERINTRVDVMVAEGLLNEVKKLYEYKTLKNLQTVGYSELFDYIDGLCTLDYAIQQIKQNTRHYAKRQMTWFKRDGEVIWINADEPTIVDTILALK